MALTSSVYSPWQALNVDQVVAFSSALERQHRHLHHPARGRSGVPIYVGAWCALKPVMLAPRAAHYLASQDQEPYDQYHQAPRYL